MKGEEMQQIKTLVIRLMVMAELAVLAVFACVLFVKAVPYVTSMWSYMSMTDMGDEIGYTDDLREEIERILEKSPYPYSLDDSTLLEFVVDLGIFLLTLVYTIGFLYHAVWGCWFVVSSVENMVWLLWYYSDRCMTLPTAASFAFEEAVREQWLIGELEAPPIWYKLHELLELLLLE